MSDGNYWMKINRLGLDHQHVWIILTSISPTFSYKEVLINKLSNVRMPDFQFSNLWYQLQGLPEPQLVFIFKLTEEQTYFSNKYLQ